jgi:hypothetical protein
VATVPGELTKSRPKRGDPEGAAVADQDECDISTVVRTRRIAGRTSFQRCMTAVYEVTHRDGTAHSG